MIAFALLLAAVPPQTAVEAERTFAAMAQTRGQWTAFREYAARDAVMFVPEEVNAQNWLKARADPKSSVMWWPAQAWVSCDGKTAVTTGPWVRAGGRVVGYFTTVWQKQPDGGWKWVLDHGDGLKQPRPTSENVETRRASCKPAPRPTAPLSVGGRSDQLAQAFGASADRSLSWTWRLNADGSRVVSVDLWDGVKDSRVIQDVVAAEPR